MEQRSAARFFPFSSPSRFSSLTNSSLGAKAIPMSQYKKTANTHLSKWPPKRGPRMARFGARIGLEASSANNQDQQVFKKVWNTNEDYLRKEVRRCPFNETHQTPVIQLPQLIILAVQYSIPIYIDEILIQAQYVSATELGRCFSQRNYHLKKS